MVSTPKHDPAGSYSGIHGPIDRVMSELNFGRIFRHAERFRDEIAVHDLAIGHRANYGEHFERVGRVCGAMSALDIRADTPFAVLANASHHYVELWRAGLVGGGVINPLNTRLAADEIIYILNDSGAEVLFVDAANAHVALEIRSRVPRLRELIQIGDEDIAGCDARLDELMNAANDSLPMEPAESAAAVLMYTGGTTGLPKGVVLSQRAIALVIYRMLIDFPIVEGTRFLNFMPMFHIGGITSWGLLLPVGGRTVILPAFEPTAVNHAIRDHEITLIGAVPTMLAQMLQQPDFQPSMLESLRLILYGAAPMPPSLLDRLMTLSSKLAFVQSYGMTECASTVTVLNPLDHRRGGAPLQSVGRPAVGVEIDLREPDGSPTVPGEIGEIYVRCDSAMTEYWNKPEQTKASLIDGWYRSGDAGRLDDQGYLYLADRVKDMIVTGGENVYSIEVENAISSHPDVIQVAVIGLPDEVWGEKVHAVVVCDPACIDEADLTAHARKTIAGFKVPKSWTLQSDPLPVSAAGKILKRELRERHAERNRAN
jgi:long-chain acyl-CoA synthetase